MKKLKNSFSQKESEIELVLAYKQLDIPFSLVQKNLNLIFDSYQDYILSLENYSNLNLNDLIQFFTIEDCLIFILEHIKKQKLFKSKIKEYFLYPFILFESIFFLLYFFTQFLIPKLIHLFNSIHLNTSFISIGYFVLNIFWFLTFIVNILLIMFLFIWFSKKGLKTSIILLSKIKKGKIIKLFFTHQFTLLFEIFYRYGFSTIDTLKCMRSNTRQYLIQWIATLLDYELQNGINFSQSLDSQFFDYDFIKLMTVFEKGENIKEKLPILENLYLGKIVNYLSKTSLNLKIFIYTTIGILVIYLYAILMMPMQLIEKI